MLRLLPSLAQQSNLKVRWNKSSSLSEVDSIPTEFAAFLHLFVSKLTVNLPSRTLSFVRRGHRIVRIRRWSHLLQCHPGKFIFIKKLENPKKIMKNQGSKRDSPHSTDYCASTPHPSSKWVKHSQNSAPVHLDHGNSAADVDDVE